MLITIVIVVVAALVCGPAIKKYVSDRRHARQQTDELQAQFLLLQQARVAVDNAALPRWAARIKDKLMYEVRDNFLAAERSLEAARKARRLPSPTARENLAAVQAAIGVKTKGALLDVVDEVMKLAGKTSLKVVRFRDKIEKSLRSSYIAGAQDEVMDRIVSLKQHVHWNASDDRALKNPLFAFAMMISHAGVLSVSVKDLGMRKRWQNGLLRYRIEAGFLRHLVVTHAREALRKIHAFRTLRKDRPEETWDAVIGSKEGSVTDKDLYRVETHLKDAKRFHENRSREQGEILEEIACAEALLMSFECALMDALDPCNEAHAECERLVTGLKVDWTLDTRVGTRRVA